MSAGHFLDLAGRMSRACPKCGVEIGVVRPPRPMAHDTPPSKRRHFSELAQQLAVSAQCLQEAGQLDLAHAGQRRLRAL
jgi:hypothetical protein